jgi:translation initiation factor 2 gamma subunit (eIF-2gamma)
MMEEKLIGKVTHFYGKPSVGMIELSDVLKVGDTIRIKGENLDFTQKVTSMRIEFTDVNEAKAGDLIGTKVDQKVHKNDEVYKVIE